LEKMKNGHPTPFRRAEATASGDVNIRVTKQPEHGTVDISPTSFYPGYPKKTSAPSAFGE